MRWSVLVEFDADDYPDAAYRQLGELLAPQDGVVRGGNDKGLSVRVAVEAEHPVDAIQAAERLARDAARSLHMFPMEPFHAEATDADVFEARNRGHA